ncbi:MAG: hypothetical protein QM723_23965 [Myxococcaceae bacterium]
MVLQVELMPWWPASNGPKTGGKLQPKGDLVLADDSGVIYSGPAPVFLSRPQCTNDGGDWNGPIARLELTADQLKHPLGKPRLQEKIVGLAVLGSSSRKALAGAANKATVMRVDFDADGKPDAELRTASHDSGCGPALEWPDLRLVDGSGQNGSARCCGP